MKPIKLIKPMVLSLVLMLVFALPVCASTLPTQQDIPLDKEWRITFNQPIDANTLQNNVVITRTDVVYIMTETFPITPTLDPSDPRVIVVKHSTPFVSGASYGLSVTNGVKDVSGKALAKETSLSFTTKQPSFSLKLYGEYSAEVTIKEITRGPQAWSMIYAANNYNNPAKNGYEYVLAKINLKPLNIKDEKSPWISSTKLKLVSENGMVYDSCYVAEPDPKFNATLYKGATTERWVGYLVKKDDLHSKLSFGTKYDGTGGICFKAYTK